MFDAKVVTPQIIKWIRDYFSENGSECVAVVGISGGKDSSIVAALCAKALGKDRVFGVLMPQGEQFDIDISKKLVEYLHIKHEIINVGETIDTLLCNINNKFSQENEQAKINTPPRIRMTTLYAVSAFVGGRVANTCNLSEDYVGYATKFGDGAGDFSPLSNLTVTEVKAIGRELGLPSLFVDKTPIDGLCGKSDEENLGFSYDILDKYIRDGICSDIKVKSRIDNLHAINMHKLKSIPSFEFEHKKSSPN